MRRLAKEVGVEAASLYHHVPNKDALIDGMLVRMRAEVRLPEPLPEDWIDLYVGDLRRVPPSAHGAPEPRDLRRRRVESDPEPDGLYFLPQIGFSEDDAVGAVAVDDRVRHRLLALQLARRRDRHEQSAARARQAPRRVP